MAAEDEVRAASAEFYAALNRMLAGDASSLGAIWSHSSTVTALHPIGDWHVGWDGVRSSFEKVAKASAGDGAPAPGSPVDRSSTLGNTSDDSGQDYLGDGIAQDLSTGLSKFSELFVIADNSARKI
jgi:hypothetical protein